VSYITVASSSINSNTHHIASIRDDCSGSSSVILEVKNICQCPKKFGPRWPIHL